MSFARPTVAIANTQFRLLNDLSLQKFPTQASPAYAHLRPAAALHPGIDLGSLRLSLVAKAQGRSASMDAPQSANASTRPLKKNANCFSISPAQIDRRLKDKKRRLRRRIYGTTRPGILLKRHIPIKTDSWDVDRPGFTEVDLVSHSGDCAQGDFAHTLNVATSSRPGWSGAASSGRPG